MLVGRGFHAIKHRARVSVKSRANVLNIEDQRIDSVQHFWSKPPCFAGVQAINRQSSGGIAAVRHVRLIFFPGESVLGREQRFHPQSRREHEIDITLAVAAEPRMIRDKSDIFPLEWREVLLTKYIQACKHVGIAVYNPVKPRTGKRLVISNETYSGKHDSIVRRGNGRYLRAK